MSEDGLAGIDFSEPCHHVVRFANRAVLIEPVELHVFVVFVRDALEASLSYSSCYNAITRVNALHSIARVEVER